MVYHLMGCSFLDSVSKLLSLVAIGLVVEKQTQTNRRKKLIYLYKQYLYKMQHVQIYLICLLLFSLGINELFY